MSNKFLDAAWPLRLSPMRKLLLIALADQANADGVACISRSKLARMTNQSRATVTRELRALGAAGLLDIAEAATAKTVQKYSLRGLTLSPGLTLNRAHTELGGGSQRAASDPSYVPSANVQASRGREISTGPRKEVPTGAQIRKLVHVIIDDPATQLTGDDGDLIEMVKRACAQADFLYDSGTVNAAINQVFASRGHAPLYRAKGSHR